MARSEVTATNSVKFTHYVHIEAARAGKPSMIRRLLDEGVDVNDAGANGLTALIMASSAEKLAAAQLLLGAGADVSKKDSLGYDAYHAPMFYGDSRGTTPEPYDEIMKLVKPEPGPQ